jgi:uncharacterized protein
MLIEFTVGNYRSFREPVTLSMVASKLVSQNQQLDENTIFEPPGGPRLLISAVIYGANAGGKSNLVAALDLLQWMILNSARLGQAVGGIPVEPFRLSTETLTRPSHFEIVFRTLTGTQYRYGFEADRERVHREWLYHVPTIREALLFERQEDQVRLGAAFKEGRGLAEKTRPNALFLSVVAQFNGQIARYISNWFLDTEIISGLDDEKARLETLSGWHDPDGFKEIALLLTNLDLSIDDVRLEVDQRELARVQEAMPEWFSSEGEHFIPGAYRVKTVHSTYDAAGQPSGSAVFDLDRQESEGTRKLFALSGPLLAALGGGTPFVADEFDARLHPIMTRKLVELFNSRRTNPRSAQLIFTTQDASLLDNRLFRRDQIWFTEKDRFGATHLYSLAEFKGVRNDASFEKDYVRGRYGAIPFLGDLGRLEGDGDA